MAASPHQSAQRAPGLPPSAQVVLGLATVPVLLGLVWQRALQQGLQELGELSEELFRSDRLPSLDPPATPPTPQTSPDAER